MVKKMGGSRRGSRHLLTKHKRAKGKISLTRYLQKLDEGQRVILAREPSIENGSYNLRFHGKVGRVVGKQGRCYKIELKDLGVKKTLLVHPLHLKKQA